MIERAMIVALAGLCVWGVGLAALALVIFGDLNPYKLNQTTVPRINISADAVIHGNPVSVEWTVPAIRHWDVPEYWLWAGAGYFRTVRSPFDTVFIQLPTGEGIGVDLGEARFNMNSNWQSVASPIEFDRTRYYLLDSVTRPRVLTEYFIAPQRDTECPKEDPILNCRISARMTLLESGPLKVPMRVGGSGLFSRRDGLDRYNELPRIGLQRPRPKIFVSLSARLTEPVVFNDDPEIEKLVGTITRPTIVWVSYPTLDRLRKLPGKIFESSALVYEGSSAWDLAETESRHQDGIKLLSVAHLTEAVTPDDLSRCCGWGPIKKERLASVLTHIKYRGELVPYGPVPDSSDKYAVLIDPKSGTVVTFYGPQTKVIWMLPTE